MSATKPRANAGISRIDQPSRRTFGFFVRLARKGRIYNAFFADKSHGGKKKALIAARKHYRTNEDYVADMDPKTGAISLYAVK